MLLRPSEGQRRLPEVRARLMLREEQELWLARKGAQAVRGLGWGLGMAGGGCGGLRSRVRESWRRRWGRHAIMSISIPREGEGKRRGSCRLTEGQQSGKPAETAVTGVGLCLRAAAWGWSFGPSFFCVCCYSWSSSFLRSQCPGPGSLPAQSCVVG